MKFKAIEYITDRKTAAIIADNLELFLREAQPLVHNPNYLPPRKSPISRRNNPDGSVEFTYTSGPWKATNKFSPDCLTSDFHAYYRGQLIYILACVCTYIDPIHYKNVLSNLYGKILSTGTSNISSALEKTRKKIQGIRPNDPLLVTGDVVRGGFTSTYDEHEGTHYHNRSNAFFTDDLTDFWGAESFTIPGNNGKLKCIYSAQYSGGLVRQHS